jgi:hypothetical protein
VKSCEPSYQIESDRGAPAQQPCLGLVREEGNESDKELATRREADRIRRARLEDLGTIFERLNQLEHGPG